MVTKIIVIYLCIHKLNAHATGLATAANDIVVIIARAITNSIIVKKEWNVRKPRRSTRTRSPTTQLYLLSSIMQNGHNMRKTRVIICALISIVCGARCAQEKTRFTFPSLPFPTQTKIRPYLFNFIFHCVKNYTTHSNLKGWPFI